MRILTYCLALFLASGVCWADEGDDTLKRWLDKSDLVVAGTITSGPLGASDELGVVNYSCDFKVSDVCKGDTTLAGKTIALSIVRFVIDERDRHPLIKKDGECILFLKTEGTEGTSRLVTSDFWFAVQCPSPWMVKSLKRLAEPEK